MHTSTLLLREMHTIRLGTLLLEVIYLLLPRQFLESPSSRLCILLLSVLNVEADHFYIFPSTNLLSYFFIFLESSFSVFPFPIFKEINRNKDF